jgi:hypothetical protein
VHLNVLCPSMIDLVVSKEHVIDVIIINDNRSIH